MINFNALPIPKLAFATFAYGFLAGRTQSEIPAADEVFVSAQANGKACVAYGSIESPVQVAACTVVGAGYNKRTNLPLSQ